MLFYYIEINVLWCFKLTMKMPLLKTLKTKTTGQVKNKEEEKEIQLQDAFQDDFNEVHVDEVKHSNANGVQCCSKPTKTKMVFLF